jgi:hypothetical protein
MPSLGERDARNSAKLRLLPADFAAHRWGQPYVDEGAAAFEKRYQQARLQRLAAMVKDLGYQLTPNPCEA